MKIIKNILDKKVIPFYLLLLSLTGFAQNFSICLANPSSTSTTLEVDVMFTVNAPAAGILLSQISTGVNYNPAILNGGTPCTTGTNFGCTSWDFIPGTKDAALNFLITTTNTTRFPYGHLRIVGTTLSNANSQLVPVGTYRLGRYRFTNTVPWTTASNAQLWLQPNNTGGASNTIVSWYVVGTTTGLLAYTTTNPSGFPPGTVVCNTAASPLSVPLNGCFTTGTYTQTPVTCFAGTDGTATITMAGIPPTLGATYVLDGGTPTAVTLTTSASFTLTGLSAGAHTLTVTGNGVCTTPVSVPFTIGGPAAALTNTTTATACDSYLWSVNGTTYTTGGTYTGTSTNASGCSVAETLNLTINASTSATTTATACDTYTWAGPLGNGVTYTTSQTGVTNVSTNAAGCPHTQTLNLTINSSTTGTTNATACDAYTWAGPLGNGLTYTTSQTGVTFVSTNAAGCPHTQTLNLTINNSTSGTTNATACDTYTWAGPLGNGTTYTTSQTGVTNVSTNGAGCPHTQTLNLTINNSTSATTTATACDTYTWAGPLGNGLTYTTSQTGITFVSTNAAGCPHTQTLNLTINNSTSATTTATACDTYTWAAPLGNGLTYTTSQTGVTNVSTNAAGCSHTQTLNLTINSSTTGTTTATSCDTYTWAAPLGNGVTYTTSQTGITNVSTNAAGCPHTQTLNLTINNSTSATTTATACDTYTWAGPLGNGLTYTTSQTGVTFVSTNAVGCQHTQTLNLTINNSTTGTTNASACSTYTWLAPLGNGVTYTTNQTGITNVSTNAAGCPNTQTLNLTINSTSGTTTTTACDTYTWAAPLGNGLTYTTSQTGITNVSTNAAGCPHTQTLNLTINSSTSATTMATACDTYTWALPLGNGVTYTTSQTGITNVTTNAAGCPHTQTLNLTINNSTAGTTTAASCNTYTWAGPLGNGLTYTSSQSGITYVTTNAAGCPHTQTLNLTMSYSSTGTTNATACNSYTWALPLGNGQTYTTSQTGITNTTPTSGGCSHIQTLNLIINTSTTGTTTATSCDAYTWVLPLGNGQTYNSSVTGATHVSTNAAGCPHTQTLNLTINNSTTHTTTVSACDTYTWAAPLGNGVTYTVSSIVTNVTTNAAGCSHTETLVLTIKHSTSGTTTTTACNSYTWLPPFGNGQIYTTNQTGITNVSTNAVGCTHTQTLNLTINNSTTSASTASACNNYTWAAPLGNGNTYTASGVYTHTTVNAVGCSHTQTLNLTINYNTINTTNVIACDTYTWALPLGNGLTYTSNASLTNVTTNASGCTHIEKLRLNIRHSSSGTTTAVACNTYTWALPLGNGQTYTTSQTGITNVTNNSSGCPHTQTLNLTINNNSSSTTNATACNSYTWALPLGNGQTYSSNQTGLTHVSTFPGGCTHTETLNLVVNQTSSHTTTVTACGSYTWALPLGNGQTYTTSQTGLTNVSTNAAGCPHTETLNLTINQSTTYGNVTTTAYNSYTWAANGVTYTTSGIYTYTGVNSGGCPNVATLNLTIIVGSTWYYDGDGDGYGNPSTALFTNVPPPGYIAIGTDCDDTRANVHPGAVEICYDGLDNDCNGVIDNVGQPGGCTPILTSLLASHCGSTITNLSTVIKAYYVVGAQGYRFRVKNLSTNAIQIKDRPTNSFTLSSLTTVNIGASYQIDVALLLNGVWQPFYGSACIVNTGSPVSTIGSQCATTLYSMNQWVYATYYSSASGYRFRVTNTTTSIVQVLNKTLNRFNFNELPIHNFGTTYFVEVALKNPDGTYLPYGPGCNITTPASGRAADTTNAIVEFKAIAYPNPFANDFKLNVTTSDVSTIQIRVYDMLGKQLENRSVEVTEIESLELGTNYPSGVYSIIVSQGDTTQTVRVIKR